MMFPKLRDLYGIRILKMFTIALIVFCIMCFFLIRGRTNTSDGAINFKIQNYISVLERPDRLEDILFSDHQPQFGKSIFFLETSKAITLFPPRPQIKETDSTIDESEVSLKTRQACAIESAALMNPNTDIFVLFAGERFLLNVTSQPFIKAVLSYPNVQLRKLNLWTFVAGSPVYEWFKNGNLFSTVFPVAHISDFLRYLTLWRWGGTYLDLDVIVLKRLENVPSNYVCPESDGFIANGVMNFAGDGFGHEVVDMCLQDFQRNFNGKDWGHNGPGVITRVLQKIYQTYSTTNMTRDHSKQFHVFPKETFYAIGWDIWEYLFEAKHLEAALDKIKDSLLTHAWNKISSSRQVKVGSNVAYGKLAEMYCPKVYASCGEWF